MGSICTFVYLYVSRTPSQRKNKLPETLMTFGIIVIKVCPPPTKTQKKAESCTQIKRKSRERFTSRAAMVNIMSAELRTITVNVFLT